VHILWLKTEFLHPLDRGGRIRTYGMLREVAKRHRVTYLTLDDGKSASDALERAREYSERAIRVPFKTAPRNSPRFYAELLANVASPLPYAVSKYRVQAFTDAVHHAVREHKPDVVVCDFLAPAVNVSTALPVPSVLFQHNVESRIWRRHTEVARNAIARVFFGSQHARMRRFEAQACRMFDHVIAVSDDDARELREDFGVPSVTAVPTGVDAEYFAPMPVERDRNEIVFTGAMDWMPNVDGIQWFVREILPLVQARRPDVRLTIVGRSPAPSIRALSETNPSITVTGTVDDIRPYLARAGAVIVPLRVGGGTRLKIYEAMGMNCPIVSTTIGAEGLPVRDGEHLHIRDTPAELADACVATLADANASAALGTRAGDYVRQHFSWAAIAEEFVRQCELAVPRFAASARGAGRQ
jgi:polysaccharide biosynthesis protein PslH